MNKENDVRLEDIIKNKVSAISIDTRTLKPGDIYIALRGEQHDGHDFVLQAEAAGASCVVVDHPVIANVPQYVVDNTERTLQFIAQQHRRSMHVKAIAVTGSCGKTSTRAFLEAIFSCVGSTHASVGSFNNHIGVPLTLLKLKPTHQFLISEVGANHVGEIAALIPLIQPDVAIITNVAPAHLEGFGSIEDVARAKAEIFDGLSSQGIAIINADDAFSEYWQLKNEDRPFITFGIHDGDVTARAIQFDHQGAASFTLCFPKGEIDVALSVIGEHTVYNALAAAAAAFALGLTHEQIKRGLEQAQAVSQRLIEHVTALGTHVIDDTYNANPLSVSAAINVLAKRSGRTILVLGDMKELGEVAVQLHADVGHQAKSQGISSVFCYGDLSRHTANAFGEQGFFYSDKQELIDALKKIMAPDHTILIKGSHSMHMDEVVAALLQEYRS